MDPAHGNEDGDQKKTNPTAIAAESDKQILGTNPVAEKETSCSSSSTSSDDTDDDDDFFQIEGAILGNAVLAKPESGDNGQLASAETTGQPVVGSLIEDDSSLAGRQKKTANSSSSPRSPTTSPKSDKLGILDPKQSPPVQAMTRADESLHPSRIPSSIFARTKSTTPMEWSVASNESLFSIHVGNSSFSKDHAFLYGKSGDLGSPSDPTAPLPPFPSLSPGSSPPGSKEAKGVAQDCAEVKSAETTKNASKGKVEGHTDSDRDGDESTNYSHSTSHRSDGSTTSFAFPILTGEAISESLKEGPQFPRRTLPQSSELQTATERPKVEETPKANVVPAPAAEAKWFPWCSCCPFCS